MQRRAWHHTALDQNIWLTSTLPGSKSQNCVLSLQRNLTIALTGSTPSQVLPPEQLVGVSPFLLRVAAVCAATGAWRVD